MLLLLTYFSPEVFKEKCKNGIKSTWHGTLNEALSDIWNDYQEEIWEGCYCPKRNDAKKWILKGFPVMETSVPSLNHHTSNLGSFRCSGSEVGGEINQILSPNRCYKYKMHLQTSCSAHAYMYFNIENTTTKKVQRPQIDDLYMCDYDDCLPGYWGQNCENGPVTFRADECTVSLGLQGTGKCTCENAQTIQEYCRPGTKPGVVFKSCDADAKTCSANQIIKNFEVVDVSNAFPYKHFEFSGKMYIPKSGKYIFRITGNSKAKFAINGKQNNDMSSVFSCEKGPQKVEVIEFLVGDTLYDYKIEYVSGCAVRDKSFVIDWKAPNSEIFTPIPEIYLFY